MQIIYRSFDGRYSDNPRAIYEALLDRGDEVEHVWMCAPGHEGDFPAGAATVPVEGPEAVEALEASDLVVANIHVSMDWLKRPGARYLQTWHGTPLKAIHRDITFHPEETPEVADRDVSRWDLLLSQNPDCSRLLRDAFGYQGPVHETGYPRNDVLSASEAPAERDRIRKQLGIPTGTTAVLYAPTWRDDDEAGDGPSFKLELDPASFAERLGPGHVLMIRLHYSVSDALGDLDTPGVLDLSEHPDIRELILAADLLVTDYTSTQFDFAVTGKPILYFAYDQDHYRSKLRDFYVDLEPIAPGPLLSTADEVLDAITDIQAVSARYQERYDKFRQRFCLLEDGHATQRVLELVLSERVTAGM